jgi:hypothetical protein
MEAYTTYESIAAAIEQALDKQIAEVKEQIIRRAVEEFNKEVREITAKTALKVSDCFSIERMGTDVIIRVKVENGRQ